MYLQLENTFRKKQIIDRSKKREFLEPISLNIDFFFFKKVQVDF